MAVLMVVGGVGALHDVELIDLSGQGRFCRKPDDFPSAGEGSVGAYIEEQTLVCGGYPYTSDCYYYNTDGTWTQGPSMTEAREYASSTILNSDLWVTGGYNPGEHGLASTECFISTSFITYVDLPVERYYHNIVSIEENRAMLLGGQTTFQEAYTFNGTWSNSSTLSRGRQYSQAGMVTFNNGTKMVVAAGGVNEQTTEFLNFDEDEWNFGPDLPYSIYRGASVQLNNTFLIVGGDSNGTALDTIWKFDAEAEEWILLNEHMTTARYYTAAFLVPNDFC